jgi:hypothetical protein
MSSWLIPPLLALITSITIFANLLVLLDFFRRISSRQPNTTTPTHYFIANLALADFLVGILVLPFLSVLQTTGSWSLGPGLCLSWTFAHYSLCACSILSTTAICIDRYIGVKYPIFHHSAFMDKRTIVISLSITSIWALAIIPSALRTFLWIRKPNENEWNQCDLRQKEVWATVLSCFLVLYIPIAVMVVLYAKIFWIASAHMNKQKDNKTRNFSIISHNKSPEHSNSSTSSSTKTQIEDHACSSDCESQKDVIPKSKDETDQISKKLSTQIKAPSLTVEERQIKLARKLAVLVGILIISYLPYFTLILLRAVYSTDETYLVSDEVFGGFAWIRYANSMVNPFIYAWAVPDTRKRIRRTMRNNVISRKLSSFHQTSMIMTLK